MPAFPRLRFRRTWRHRLGVACTFFAYLVASLNLPLPAAVHKDSSQPFPCQDHPCGCQTAEQCWRQCCCFTPEQRWAWARAHQVEPPAYAEKPAAEETPAAGGWNTVKLRDRDRTPAAPAKNCCAARATDPACCRGHAERPARQSSPKSDGVRWVMGLSARQCQGLSTLWISVGSVLPIPLPLAWSPEQPPLFRVPVMVAIAGDVPLDPPAPPPRRSLV